MSSPTPPPGSQRGGNPGREIVVSRSRVRALDRIDRQFLPAALEILDTPPSPVRMALLLIICAFVVSALAWSYFSRIDIIAVAQGKLQPTGRVKVIQPLETSRVLTILVENGQAVKAGQPLAQLDPSDAAADAASLAGNLVSYRAEAQRRQVAINAAQARDLSASLAVPWAADIPSAIREREERVYSADLSQLQAQVASLSAQTDQKHAEQDRLRMMIAAEKELIATLQERVTMKTTLMEHDAGSRADMLTAMQTLQDQKTSLAQQQGQLAEANANILVFARDTTRAYETFVADNAQKLAEAERQAADYAERLGKARARLDHTTLRSPIAGTVLASTLTTVGQVVTSGQEVMRIVPESAGLEIECYLPNKDIGFVQEGDHAILKVESFPFTRYGTIDATVVRVARDAIPEPDAEQIEKDGIHNGEPASASGGQRTQNLVFPVSLWLSRQTIDVDGKQVALGAGMSVTVEIRTGSRRILEYVFSPLAKVASEAMKER